MAFDIAKTKSLVRRTVHDTFGVRAFYKDTSMNVAAALRARWHNKIDRFGDLESQGYAEIVQGIDRVIFEAAEARRLNVRRGGEVTFPSAPGTVAALAFILQVREPSNGAFEECWTVSRKETQP